MFCIKCGTNLPDDAIVCYKCAHPVNQQPIQVQPLQQTENLLNDKKNKEQVKQQPIIINQKSGAGAVFLTLLLGVVASALGIGFVYYQQQREAQNKLFGFEIKKNGVSASWGLGGSGSSSSPTDYSAPVQKNKAQTAPIFSNDYSSSGNTARYLTYCLLSNNGKAVHLRVNCDSQSCDEDASTMVGGYSDGTRVEMLDAPDVPSAKNYTWRPVELGGQKYYVSSNKLDCAPTGN